MFASNRTPGLAEAIAGIDHSGGWIPGQEASVILRRLDDTSALARTRYDALPREVMLPLAREGATTLLEHVLEDARAMLDAACQRGADLFMVLD